ncbi:MAG: leucine--tRNA ligase [Bacteroidia bacterium]|nr:leucine--tRNA ligase [Bacteroidia bacterium]
MQYNFKTIEAKWQKHWAANQTFKAENNSTKPKYYVLDMFPYPSGAGLHVGHPLGYIASDIYARYKRHTGFNVLHPMGYDSFGLPAEQYAIQTGQHPAITTTHNIARYREQLDKIGFSFDWSREVKTSEPNYYKWTQWIFGQLFNSWYDVKNNKAANINDLLVLLKTQGNIGLQAVCDEDTPLLTPAQFNQLSDSEVQQFLLHYRMTYLANSRVNWCPNLGTVLSNDEVKDGLSERGGHPVEQRLMRQWSMRISAYSERLLTGLDNLDWTESIKEIQRYWIGKSKGASLKFNVIDAPNKEVIEVFTTRPDTVFGVSFVTLSPEHELLQSIVPSAHRAAVNEYATIAKNRTERERMTNVKHVSGVFTGAYVQHPFTGQAIPVWVGDYVLAGYGTGAVMAVPAHDSRDYAFAQHFNLPITEVILGGDITAEAYEAKEGTLINSDFLNGLDVKKATDKIITEIEQRQLGKGKINYRLRDAIFSRQRYWGEPIPVEFDAQGMPTLLPNDKLPLVLPEIDKYLPTETGEPPLARAENWNYDTNTMPGWAGSSWYFFRYMDSQNANEFASKEALNYWKEVDLYIGGSEHATGHLLYARFWTKFLFDRGFVGIEEPFKKLINQGMIQGRSNFVYRIKNTNTFVSYNLREQHDITALNVDVNIVRNDVLDIDAFRKWLPEYANAEFMLEEDKYVCGVEVEKMSKSKWNVVSPDDICAQYGADTLRLYEMFLGPLELAKPWNTNGIEGVLRFLKKLWRLVYDQNDLLLLTNETPTPAEYKALHKCIKKVTEDIERFSFNTSVSSFMICVNELNELKCNKKEIVQQLSILLSPYAPHIAEELWSVCGNATSIATARFPVFNESYLVENSFAYPISINGKMRMNLDIALGIDKEEIEKIVLANADVLKQIAGKELKKIIVVPGKIVNIVVG